MNAKPQQTHSNPQLLWSGRGSIDVFIRCLHLLDLDILPDWPGLSAQSFSTKHTQQNLQHRLKGVEWALYRLFEIYNLEETRNVGLGSVLAMFATEVLCRNCVLSFLLHCHYSP